MNHTDCIADDRLKLLLLGELPEPEAQPLEEHLLECPSCVARTRSLKLDDTLVAALQHAGGPAAGGSPVVEQLVAKLSDRSHLATHSSLLGETQDRPHRPGTKTNDLIARFEPPQAPDELGRLGGFRVLKLLGQGGMGAVFLAEDIQLRRQVALKLLRPEQAAHEGAAERFLREARAAAAVKHDNVVTIYQVGQAQGMPFIAQELLEGETLEDRLKKSGRIPIGESLAICREIAAGLAAAHERGLLHRDVKPSNVWLERSGDGAQGTGDRGHHPGRVKILDFGLARNQQGDEQLTQSGAIVGTPAYMSPEQAQGRELDARTDLFSLGGVLYRMLTARLPFQGTDVLSILRSLAVDTPPPARSLNKEVPAELSALIADLLQKDRDRRPDSAAAVAKRLAEIESTWGRPLACPAKKPASRIRWIAAVVVAALIALAVFLTIKTPHGEITVELGKNVNPNDVQIEVAGNNEVKIADAKNNWTIDVKEGQYSVQLKKGNDRLDLSHRSVTVTRNKKTHLTVTLKPLAAANPQSEISNPKSEIPNPKSPAGGYALEFNGKDSYVDLPTLRYDGSHPITLEATIFAERPRIAGVGMIAGWKDAALLGISRTNGRPAFGCTDKDNQFTGPGSWNNSAFGNGSVHIAAVWDGREQRIYFRGELQTLVDNSGIVVGASKPLLSIQNLARSHARPNNLAIGCDIDPKTEAINSHFLGRIDELRISKIARYTTSFTPPPRLEADEHTLALFHFDEGAGEVLTDSSGHNHHGKIVNAKWVPGIAGGPADRQAPAVASGFALDLSAPLNAGFATVQLPAGPPAEKPCTIEMFVVPRSVTAAAEGRGLWALMGALSLKQSGDRFRLTAFTGDRRTSTTISSDDALVPRKRVFLAGVSTGQELRLFVDGKLAGISRVNGPIAAALGHTLGGQGPAQFGWEAFDGPLDEIRLSTIARYDRDFTPPERLEADQHTFALYHCDEGQGQALLDTSGHGRDGKLFGTKWAPGIAGGRPAADLKSEISNPISAPPLAIAPFTALEAQAHQAAWAKHLNVPVEYTNSLGMKLRLVPPGEFLMGSPPEEIAELLAAWDPGDKRGPECIASAAPQHRVILTRPMYAGVREVTQQQYAEIMGDNPAAFAASGSEKAALEKAAITDTSTFPVESVSWLDALEFCRKLTIREKVGSGGGYRLPTEAEWEFACRAGTTSQYHNGDGEKAAVAAGWFRGNSGLRPHVGGELGINPFGLSDMHGNVWEWMLDRRDITYYARRHPEVAVNPQSPTSPTAERVLRGGNWRGIAEIGRAAFRDGRDEFHRHYDYGFRVWLPVDSLLASGIDLTKP